MPTPTPARQDSLRRRLPDPSQFIPEIAEAALAPLSRTRLSWAGRL